MRLLIRWVQHEAGLLPGDKGASLETIVLNLGTTRGQLTKLLSDDFSNWKTRDDRVATVATALKPILDRHEGKPDPVVMLMEAVYGPQTVPLDLEVVKSPQVLKHRALSDTDADKDFQRPLVGLSFLLRVANEPAPKPRPDDPHASTLGFSLGLLTVPLPSAQRGKRHPLFKLAQRSVDANNEVTIEGVIAQQPDRLVLEGIARVQSRAFLATLPIDPNSWPEFRTAPKSDPAIRAGVLHGVSTAGKAFVGPFRLIAVPDGVPPATRTSAEQRRFDDIYQQAKSLIGVRDLDGTLAALQSLGLRIDAAVLDALRDRALLLYRAG